MANISIILAYQLTTCIKKANQLNTTKADLKTSHIQASNDKENKTVEIQVRKPKDMKFISSQDDDKGEAINHQDNDEMMKIGSG